MKTLKKSILSLFCFLISFSSFGIWKPKIIEKGQSGKTRFVVEELSGDFRLPWGFDFLSPSEMIITEKSGKISKLNLKTGAKTKIDHSLQVMERGQGGLLDIQTHPNFPETPWIYVTYVKNKQGQGVTTLTRFQLAKNKMVNKQILLETQSATDTGRHFGSRIAFDGEGHVFFTVGDRGHRPNGQDLTTHAGTVIRLKEDGKVPHDNPFVGSKNKLAEIWSWGHRNPQGLVFDSQTKTLWEIEHGPRGGDEINKIQKGQNYGWARVSFGKEYRSEKAVGEATKMAGMADPIYQYTPSIAPCGLEIYRGSKFPGWQGQLFTGSLALTHLNRIALTPALNENRLLEGKGWRIRNVKEGPDQLIYLSTDRGQILRLSPSF